MRPSDIVSVASSCKGERRFYEVGEIGMVVRAEHHEEVRHLLYEVLFEDGTEWFAESLLEVISEAR